MRCERTFRIRESFEVRVEVKRQEEVGCRIEIPAKFATCENAWWWTLLLLAWGVSG